MVETVPVKNTAKLRKIEEQIQILHYLQRIYSIKQNTVLNMLNNLRDNRVRENKQYYFWLCCTVL